MKCHLIEDSDEENCSDLIRLFDNDVNAVYYGSQSHEQGSIDIESFWTLEPMGNDEFRKARLNSPSEGSDDDIIQMSQSSTPSECDISPLSVKLVDCGKFPWYFRKYTQQIIQKINSNGQSDDDSDYLIDEEDVDVDIEDYSDDCFVVEDVQDVTNEINKNSQDFKETALAIESPPKINTNLETMKLRKDDKEIQRALRFKNMVKVDLKRNQGLVGMKITPKIRTNTTQAVKANREDVVKEGNANKKCMMSDEKNAAKKPILDKIESNINNKTDFDGKRTVKSSGFQNVAFEISKVSEKLIDNLMTQNTINRIADEKTVSKVVHDVENKFIIINEMPILGSKVTVTEKNTKSPTKVTSHVRDVTLTNKYKSNQRNKKSACQNSLVGQLISNKMKEIKEIKCTNRKIQDNSQSATVKLDKKLHTKTKKQKLDPKSPILQSFTVPNKTVHEITPKYDKTDTNPAKANKIIDTLSNINICNLMHDTRPKSLDAINKQTLQKEPDEYDLQDKSTREVVRDKSLTMSDELPRNCKEVKNYKHDFKTNNFQSTSIKPVYQKPTYEQNVDETNNDIINKHVLNPTFKQFIKNNKAAVSNTNVSTTSMTPSSEPKSSYQNVKFPSSRGPYFPIHNTSPNRMSNNNISNTNINYPVQNRYASAIILKPNHPNFPHEKFQKPSLQTIVDHLQKPMKTLSYTQQRFRDPQPPYPIFYPPAPSGRMQSYFPSQANSIPNQFEPPYGHISQKRSNQMRNFYADCWVQQSLPPPPPPPPPIPQTNISWRNSHEVNKSQELSNLNRPLTTLMQNPQSVSYENSVNTKTENSSIIGINNDGLVKKINIVDMSTKKYDTNMGMKIAQKTNPQIMSTLEDSELVATKTEMLKELDKLAFADEKLNESGMCPAVNISKETKENTLEVAIMSKKPGTYETLKLTMNKKDDTMQTKPPTAGYSPPILPIPTYQKLLNQVLSNTRNSTPKIALRPGDPRSNIKNETKPVRKTDNIKSCKRKLNNAWNNEDNRKKEDAKKISLDEYKKRIKSDHNKKTSKEMCNRQKIDLKLRKNVDNNTETDLGYDSDSTVVL